MKEHPIPFRGPMVQAVLAERKTQTRRVVTSATAEFGSAPAEFWKHCDLEGARHDPGGSIFGNGTEYLHVSGHAGECKRCKEMAWDETTHRLYPRVSPGDLLWVREKWAPMCSNADPYCYCENDSAHYYVYRADVPGEPFPGHWPTNAEAGEDLSGERPCWRSPLYMPRKASRITLRVTDVRVQRVREISGGDAWAEGLEYRYGNGNPDAECGWRGSPDLDWRGSPQSAFQDLWDAINAKRGFGWDVNPWVVAISFERVSL